MLKESFIARQPVFNATKAVFGYELLFRDGLENCFKGPVGDHATLDVLATTLFHTPLVEMVGGKQGLINFTRNVLISDLIYLFEKEHMIVEVLETVQPDDVVIEACRKLKQAGYVLALDDFVAGDLEHPLLELADIVKVDFLQARGADRKTIAQKLLPRKIKLLAEKVETHEDFKEGLQLGYEYYQGYFFSKPVMKTLHKMAPSGIACMKMLQAVNNDEFTFEELNDIVKSDVTLSYRVLRLVNSPMFSFRPDIRSTMHALTLMGRSHIRRFISIVAVNLLSTGKPSELIVTSMMRARLAEEIALRTGAAARASEFFLMGLFSLMDAMLDRTMEDLLSELPVSHDVKTALLGGENPMKHVLDTIIAYESAKWDEVETRANAISLDAESIPRLYASAIEWANHITVA
jgi:c-di-GMP-related signal transduction protein